ncbi:MAG: lytic transglycosylase domain-containing protein [Acetobacteraceae bacterium]|nr:lytic transglycosylase domain-containing protein [Acetobacteraceae bacterium]
MHRFILLLPLLILLLAPNARGETPRLPGRGIAAFHSLFQVPPPAVASPLPARPPGSTAPASTAPGSAAPGILCRAAISAAERAHGIPAGLLLAIGLVESGRTDPATGQRHPWPWAVNAEGRGALFDTREGALAFVRQSEAAGTRSIDIGCMQVNRVHHPDAFASLEQGFDPAANADYAARFLRQLKEGPGGGDWMKAAGFYHSQTPERAEPYRARVQAALGGLPQAARLPVAMPGGGGQGLGNGAEHASMLAAAPGAVGRGLDAYRARPVPLALVARGLVTSPIRRGALSP